MVVALAQQVLRLAYPPLRASNPLRSRQARYGAPASTRPSAAASDWIPGGRASCIRRSTPPGSPGCWLHRHYGHDRGDRETERLTAHSPPDRRIAAGKRELQHAQQASVLLRPVRPERIWNGEAGKDGQTERLRRATPGLIKPDLGRTRINEESRAGFPSQVSWVRVPSSPSKLRGSVESAEYKHLVLGLLFLKYISDSFERRRLALEALLPEVVEEVPVA